MNNNSIYKGEQMSPSSLARLNNEIIPGVTRLLTQLRVFINEFNNLVIREHINVITDSEGNISIDVDANMSEERTQQLANRVDVLHSLIHNHQHNIEDLLERGLSEEQSVLQNNPNYVRRIPSLQTSFNTIIRTYVHR